MHTKSDPSIENITIEDFVMLLCKNIAQLSIRVEDCSPADEVMAYAHRHGIVNELDVIHAKHLIDKRIAARILHYVLRNILGEKDNSDWSAAYTLKDIYDCHTCVGNIAQMYVKGIIEGWGVQSSLFGICESITWDKAQLYIDRLSDKDMRLKIPSGKEIPFSKISKNMLCEICDKISISGDRNYVVVDIRSREEYLEAPLCKGSINIPFKQIYLNPYIVSQERDCNIYILSETEYDGTLIAELLTQYGYTGVYLVCE